MLRPVVLDVLWQASGFFLDIIIMTAKVNRRQLYKVTVVLITRCRVYTPPFWQFLVLDMLLISTIQQKHFICVTLNKGNTKTHSPTQKCVAILLLFLKRKGELSSNLSSCQILSFGVYKMLRSAAPKLNRHI